MFDDWVNKDETERVCGLLRQYLDGACFDVFAVYKLKTAEKERLRYTADIKLFQGETFIVDFEIKEEKVELILMDQMMDVYEELSMLAIHMFDEMVLGEQAESVCGLLRAYLSGTIFDVLDLFGPEIDEREGMKYYATIKLFQGEILDVIFVLTKEKVKRLSISKVAREYEDPIDVT